MILETSFIIDVMKNDRQAVSKLMGLVEKNIQQCIASPLQSGQALFQYHDEDVSHSFQAHQLSYQIGFLPDQEVTLCLSIL